MLLLRKAISYGRRLELRKMSDNDLKVIWSMLVDLEENYLFWVGDILDEIEKRHGNDSAREAIKHSPDPEKFRQAKITSQIFSEAIGQRHFNLDWRYYREVVVECGKNSKECIEWLQKAEANHWTVPQMRKEIRLTHAEPDNRIHEKRTVTLMSELLRFTKSVKTFVKDRPVEQWSPAELSAFLDDAEPLLELVGKAHDLEQITQSAETPPR
jgi:hypothetical protein